MAQDEIHVGDVGTILKLTFKDAAIAVDISSATTKSIILTNSLGTKTTNAGTFTTDGTDGQLQYTSLAATFDETGLWQIQGHIVISSGEWKTDITDFKVHPNL